MLLMRTNIETCVLQARAGSRHLLGLAKLPCKNGLGLQIALFFPLLFLGHPSLPFVFAHFPYQLSAAIS